MRAHSGQVPRATTLTQPEEKKGGGEGGIDYPMATQFLQEGKRSGSHNKAHVLP